MVQIRAVINKSGNKSYFEDTIGELVESNLGYTSAGVKKTINMQNFNSVSVEAIVTLPNDPEMRHKAESEVDATFATAFNKAFSYLGLLEDRLTK